MFKNTQKKNSIFKDERDEEIHTKSKSYNFSTKIYVCINFKVY